jgi:signal peptidase I
MSAMKESYSTVLYIALGILLAFGLNQGLAFGLSTELPIVAVESNSMVPTFQKGDILILQGIPAEDLKVEDIVVFNPPNQDIPVVHRIVLINPDGTFQTKGDANNGQLPFEKSIQASQIKGKEIIIIPYLGWVKIGINEYILPNIILIIAFAGVAGAGYYTYKKRK